MRPEEINKTIAEHCGWHSLINAYYVDRLEWFRGSDKCATCDLPDYYNDLNAMHDAEGTLTHDEWRIFLGFLMNNRVIPKLASMEDFHEACKSTAAQRAESFLKTVGKWEEE